MKSLTILHSRQRGIVLFFALIALLAMSLAAVALLRSVDTSATISSDAGVENAVTYMGGTALANAGTNPVTNAAHALNQDIPASGYYATMNPALNLTNPLLWQTGSSAAVNPDGSNEPTPDSSGNRVRYIIQRMCRTSGVIIPNAKCLFGEAPPGGEMEGVKRPQDWCDLSSPGCPTPGQTPLLLVTARTQGPKGTISFVQVIVY
jgi:Tfp pilus assembly protein PilX